MRTLTALLILTCSCEAQRTGIFSRGNSTPPPVLVNTITTRVNPASQDAVQTFAAKYTVYFRPTVTLGAAITPTATLPTNCAAVFTPATVDATGGPTSASVTCSGSSTPASAAALSFNATSGTDTGTVTAAVNVIACCAATRTGTVTTLALGANLQTAVNAALGGDTIVLPDNYTWTGNLVLPFRAANDVQIITIKRASAVTPGQRILPIDSLPSLLSATQDPVIANDFNNSNPALRTTHHWKFSGIKIGSTSGFSGINYAYVYFWVPPVTGSTYNASVRDLSHDLILDHIFIHGADGSNDIVRAVRADANNVTLQDSYIDNIRSQSYESNAFCAVTTQGGMTLINNFLEAAGENVFFGAGPDVFNLVGSGYTVQNNYFHKRLSWRDGIFTVKNVLEWKSGQNAQIDHNVFENNWQAQQSGAVFLLTPRTGNGTYNDIFVRNIVFTDNVIRHAPEGISILDYDNGATINGSIPLAQVWRSGNYTFQNNWLDDISGCLYANCGNAIGYGFAFSGLADNMTLDNNTVTFTPDAGDGFGTNNSFYWGSQYQYATQPVGTLYPGTYPAALNFKARSNVFSVEVHCDGNNGATCVPRQQGDAIKGVFTNNVVMGSTGSRIADWTAQFPTTYVNTNPGGLGANTTALAAGECVIKTGNRSELTCIPGQAPVFPAVVTYVQGCVNSAGAATVSCVMPANVTSGNLLVVTAKIDDSSGTPAIIVSSSSGVSCSWQTAVATSAPVASTLAGTMAYCNIPSTGAQTVTITRSGGCCTSAFTDVTVAEYSVSTGWKTPALDVSASVTANTATTSCAAGPITTTNASDLVISTCMNFNVGQTWPTVTGYANRAASSRNTTGFYDKTVSATGSNSFAATIASDINLAMIAAFKAN